MDMFTGQCKRIKPTLRSNNGFSNYYVKTVAIHKNKKFILLYFGNSNVLQYDNRNSVLNYIVDKIHVTKIKKYFYINNIFFVGLCRCTEFR